jgi:hypothetical protein
MQNAFNDLIEVDKQNLSEDPENGYTQMYNRGRASMKGHIDVVFDYLIQQAEETKKYDDISEPNSKPNDKIFIN